MSARIRRIPWITMAFAALALVAWLIPGLHEALQFDRAAIARGELWRILTGHITHWTVSHLAWDLAAFVLLGALIERNNRFALSATLISSSLAISATIWLLAPELATYRGLSGVDSALFAGVVANHLSSALAARHRGDLLWATMAGIGFISKLGLEIAMPTPLFVEASAAFVPVPLAHGVGAVCGLVVWVIMARTCSRAASSRTVSSARTSTACASSAKP